MEVWEMGYEDFQMPKELILESLVNNKKGLTLSLSDYYDENRTLDIFFKYGAVAYRCFNEGEYLRTFNYLNGTYGSDFLSKCKIFKVENSRFMNCLKEESVGLFDCKSEGCEQYVIFTVNEVIEVIAYNKPEIII
ncbi:hypothetical protein NNC19_01425 [Clostridium sp. SHJSY1]|uniref:hypothetical protein n=1 Tax=Clostridium sp. SHJSY1 TaxID=2942483 RepID=UPI0028757E3F|nr:hypothetical protein [Clostridium sp. SHJSY1]MDS0524319.1 hypothetical protein [Clostridium sp. SHJSY1]